MALLDGPVLRGGDGALNAPTSSSAYIIPKNGQLVFGFNELNSTGYRERGLRMRLGAGSGVGAPAAGRISFAGPYRSYGQIVIVEHGGGWTTLITNLETLSVGKGAAVTQGMILGRAGIENTEITFELRRNGRTMDIAALLF